MSSAEWTATARWIFPVAGPPLERGTLTIDDERIAAVKPHGERAADIDFGNTAILPGLVNAHTHLDLSGMRGQCPPSADFTRWLREVVHHRRGRTAEQVQADISEGLAECVRSGTMLLGDISAMGQSWAKLAEAPLRAVVFREILGLTTERAAQSWKGVAAEWLSWRTETPTCRVGLSPHAPYSVRSSLFQEAAGYVRQCPRPIPVAVHLAETAAELELLNQRTGSFVDFLRDMHVWDPAGPVTSLEEIIDEFRDLRYVLWIHANYLDPQTPIGPGGTIVYCPRTHAAFGHRPHPFREFLARGVRVALGTDSLASNPDLDILAEARFVHERYPDVPGATLLRMLTINGAEALGWGHETGSLVAGKSADFAVVPLPDVVPDEPHRLLFEANLAVRESYFRGRQAQVIQQG